MLINDRLTLFVRGKFKPFVLEINDFKYDMLIYEIIDLFKDEENEDGVRFSEVTSNIDANIDCLSRDSIRLYDSQTFKEISEYILEIDGKKYLEISIRRINKKRNSPDMPTQICF